MPFPALSFHSFTTSIFSMPYARNSGSSSAVISSPLAAIGIAGGQETQGLAQIRPTASSQEISSHLPKIASRIRIFASAKFAASVRVLFFLLRQRSSAFFNALKIPFRIFGGCHQHHRIQIGKFTFDFMRTQNFCDLSAAIALFARKIVSFRGRCPS